MSASPTSTAPQDAQVPPQHPLSILRTETVLSRFPIHNLTRRGPVTIHIYRPHAHHALQCRWEVSYNARYGQPGPLAYKLDTIVINQRLDALPRPLPRLIRLGSLRHTGALLGVNTSGRQQGHLKTAFHQNASAYIVARLRYRGREGAEHRLDASFTRYSVLFTGDLLPDGTPADAIYLMLSDPYREVLNHAPVRPLDYAYLKALTPTAQRFYEIVSYKIFAALTRHWPHATLRYTEYCLFSTQQRCKTYDQVKKQMYKVHQPHLRSGYVVQVRYEATTDAEGQPDWLLHYTPGPKARTDFAAFTRPLSPTAAAATLVTTAEDGQEALVATVVRERPAILPSAQPPASTAARDTAPQPTHPPATLPNRPTHVPPPAATDLLEVQVQALVAAFYQRFHGLDHVPASPKELDHATQLLTDHGEAKAHFLLTYAQQAAPATDYHPRTFMGILHYLPYALAAYDTQATQRAQAIHHQAIRTERRCQERYLAWRQEALAQLRSTCPPAVLAGLETAQRDRLMAASTPAVALDFAIRVAVDDVLAAQAELLPFEVWRQEQEEAR